MNLKELGRFHKLSAFYFFIHLVKFNFDIMVPVGALYLFPTIALVIAYQFPDLVFQPPPVGTKGEPLLRHCGRLGRQFMVVSFFLITIVWWLALTFVSPITDDHSQFVVKHVIPILAYYVFAILFMAFQRGKDIVRVTGQQSGLSWRTEVASQHLQNTTDQIILFVFSLFCLNASLTTPQLALIPASVSLWISGQVLFLLGYSVENLTVCEFGFELMIFTRIACLAFAGLKLYVL